MQFRFNVMIFKFRTGVIKTMTKLNLVSGLLAIFCMANSAYVAAKPVQKIPESFNGVWIKADSAKDEKQICKSKSLISDEDFILQFNRKNNTYQYQSYSFSETGKIQSFSSVTENSIKGKARIRSEQEGEESRTTNGNFDFSIKNDRLFSSDFIGKTKKSGLYHCR